jgi:14-3-3 protein epsilon
LEAYKAAYKEALTTLSASNPTRLGLALNFAVFYHEIWHSAVRACHLAKQALDDAIADLKGATGSAVRETVMILQIMQGNIKVWNDELDND